jgi:hypothetical protein
MNIQRIRLSSEDSCPLECHYCEGPTLTGYQFFGGGIVGKDGVDELVVCDRCLHRAKKSSRGLWHFRAEPPWRAHDEPPLTVGAVYDPRDGIRWWVEDDENLEDMDEEFF